MASVLFTAFALIAAGQAGNVPSVTGAAPLRCSPANQAPAQPAKTEADREERRRQG